MSFRDLYDEHFPFVWRSLRRLGIVESDLPDALQDVFLVVHRRLGEFQGRSKMSTWLFGICFRVASDRRKAARAIRHEGSDDPFLDTPDGRVDIAAEAERREGLALLETLLDALPLEQRAVFTLFELEGMSGEDIAETLDIPLGTVYSRLRLSRDAFHSAVARMQARQRFVEDGGPKSQLRPVGPKLTVKQAGGKR